VRASKLTGNRQATLAPFSPRNTAVEPQQREKQARPGGGHRDDARTAPYNSRSFQTLEDRGAKSGRRPGRDGKLLRYGVVVRALLGSQLERAWKGLKDGADLDTRFPLREADR
jgi:hypothetical protein